MNLTHGPVQSLMTGSLRFFSCTIGCHRDILFVSTTCCNHLVDWLIDWFINYPLAISNCCSSLPEYRWHYHYSNIALQLSTNYIVIIIKSHSFPSHIICNFNDCFKRDNCLYVEDCNFICKLYVAMSYMTSVSYRLFWSTVQVEVIDYAVWV